MNRETLIWLAMGAAVFAVVGTGVYVSARGIRNKNPGNIRHGGGQWQGMAPEQTDTEYVQFTDEKYGIRAMAKLLRNYQTRYGLNTVHGIISRWAPPNENLTAAYIAAVSQRMGVPPALFLNLQPNDGAIVPLIKAIIHHENGSNPYSNETIKAGIALA